jgi:hypothetical protein
MRTDETCRECNALFTRTAFLEFVTMIKIFITVL